METLAPAWALSHGRFQGLQGAALPQPPPAATFPVQPSRPRSSLSPPARGGCAWTLLWPAANTWCSVCLSFLEVSRLALCPAQPPLWLAWKTAAHWCLGWQDGHHPSRCQGGSGRPAEGGIAVSRRAETVADGALLSVELPRCRADCSALEFPFWVES